MSIRSMAAIAVQRDEAPPKKVQRVRGDAETSQVPQGWSDVLIAAIPTEVLAVYTAIVGVIVGTIQAGDDELLELRWPLYGVFAALVALWLVISYRRQRTTTRRRRFPVAETFAAVTAFAAWGLVMPGSPLSVSLDTDWRAILSAIITGGAVLVLGMLGTPLKGKVK